MRVAAATSHKDLRLAILYPRHPWFKSVFSTSGERLADRLTHPVQEAEMRGYRT